jgi:hypothetical protein
MIRYIVALFALIAMSACAQPVAKNVATDSVDTLEAIWLGAATVCTAQTDPAVKTKCANVLLPARAVLLSAALDVDNGGKNYECELVQVADAVTFVGALVTLPPAVTDALALVGSLKCVPPDAGQPTNVVNATTDAAMTLSTVYLLDGGAQ